MFDNIFKFFKKIGKKEPIELTSKDMAKERLHLVLMQDRANVSADFLDMMKQEIIEVIKKYIDVNEDEIDVRLTNKMNEDGTVGAPALYANIPIAGVKSELQNAPVESKEEEKEEKKDAKKVKEDNKKPEPKEEASNDAKKVEDNKKEEKTEEVKEVKEEKVEEKKIDQEDPKIEESSKIIKEAVEIKENKAEEEKKEEIIEEAPKKEEETKEDTAEKKDEKPNANE